MDDPTISPLYSDLLAPGDRFISADSHGFRRVLRVVGEKRPISNDTEPPSFRVLCENESNGDQVDMLFAPDIELIRATAV
jgi:hypothetical protein